MEVLVGSTVDRTSPLKVASTTETVEVAAAPPLVDATRFRSAAVVNQSTVQEIPLNGRHFVDLRC